MTQATVVRNYKDLDQSQLLGFLEFHTIGDLKIHKEKLAEVFDDNGLDKKFLPEEIKPHDAYRRATKTAESQIDVTYNQTKQKARLLVREVIADSNMVVRHLVRELVDVTQKDLAYHTVGKFILDKKSGTMDISWDLGFLQEYPYDTLIKSTQRLFNEWTQYHTRDTVHNLVRRVINSMNHVSIMPNGKATFIPRTQRMTLDGIAGVIRDLKPYHSPNAESVMEIIPLIDTLEQREKIQQRVESQISHEANVLLADFADLLSRESFDNVKVVKRYAEKVYELQERVEEYDDLIGRKMDVLHSQLMDAMKRIRTTEANLQQERS